MVLSPARLNLTCHCFQAVLLVWIALLSLPQRWAEGQKMVQEMEGATFYAALILGLDLQEPRFCSLLLWVFAFFFPLLFPTPSLPPKYSLEQGLETRDSFPVNVSVTEPWSCSCCLWSSEYLCAKQKAHEEFCTLWVRAFSPGWITAVFLRGWGVL